jgi:type I restriction enzyme, S subunit
MSPDEEDGVVTAFRDGQVTLRENRRSDGFMLAEKEIGYQRVLMGDLVVHSMDAFAGAIGVSDSTGKCTPEYVVLTPRTHGATDNRFYAACLRLMAQQGYIFVICPSVRERAPRFRYETFKDVILPVPSADEQQKIADVLEKKLAAVDTLIARKVQLITLLVERRQALVTKAVTKGLTSGVSMKNSGVPWIGEIPRHWLIKRTRHACSLTTGGRDTQDAVDNGAYPFFVRSDTIERIDTYSFDGEGVLTSGDGAGVGKNFHHHIGKLEFHQRVYLYFNFKDVLGRFFYFYLREHLAKVVLAGNAKSTVDSLRRPMLLDFPVVIPPLEEQEAIIASLDEVELRTRTAIDKVEAQITRFREYRQALITAAVTGRLDLSAIETSTDAIGHAEAQIA